MAKIMRAYVKHGVNVPIRVDHVPTMADEISTLPGYDAMGRLFAIGYLKGILDAVDKK
jgi:mannonate dehydratase